MKNKIIFFSLFCLLLCLMGCNPNVEEEIPKEELNIIHSLEDGRYLSMSFIPTYKGVSLIDALKDNTLTIDSVKDKLEKIEMYKDGGSILYKYDNKNEEFGDTSFYVMVCNTLDGVKDIYLARYKENIVDKCNALVK